MKEFVFYSRQQLELACEKNSTSGIRTVEDISEETSPDSVPNLASSASRLFGASGDRFVSSRSELLF